MPATSSSPRHRTDSRPGLHAGPQLGLHAGLVAGLALLSLGACTLRGSGTEAVEVRELDAIDAIDVGGAFEVTVHVSPGTTQRVEVRGDDNIVPEVLTTVSGGELDVTFNHWMVRPSAPIELELWVSELESVDLSGASELRIEGIHGERFQLDLSGASECRLAGRVDELEIDSSGASDLDARGLEAKSVEIDLSGSGNAEVWASERLEAEISGAGHITYFGQPEEVSQSVSGAGKIEPG